MNTNQRARHLRLPEATAEDEAGAADRQFVAALGRGLDILRCFDEGDAELGNQDFVQRTGLPKATVSRLTYTLARLGFLTYVERSGRYTIGAGVVALARTMLNNLDIRQLARPQMLELAERFGAVCCMAARDRNHIVFIEMARSSSAITLSTDVGSRVPIESTALGRAYLAVMPADERTALLADLKQARGKDWPAAKAAITQGQEQFRRQGFVVSLQSWQRDVNAVAVPLVMPNGSGIYSFMCGGPSFLIKQAALENEIGPALRQMVYRLEVGIGGRRGVHRLRD